MTIDEAPQPRNQRFPEIRIRSSFAGHTACFQPDGTTVGIAGWCVELHFDPLVVQVQEQATRYHQPLLPEACLSGWKTNMLSHYSPRSQINSDVLSRLCIPGIGLGSQGQVSNYSEGINCGDRALQPISTVLYYLITGKYHDVEGLEGPI